MAPSRKITKSEVHEFSGPAEFIAWIKTLKSRLSERTVVLLEGNLGAGKTFFVQELIKNFGGNNATSPSFAIHNRYESTRGYIDHIDLYRLTDFDDLESTGFWDLFAAPKGLVLIEWGDRLPLADLPLDWHLLRVKIEIVGGVSSEKRRVILTEFE